MYLERISRNFKVFVENCKVFVEKSTNTLQFLDVDIKISENTVDTWVWRKPYTNTALFLSFAAI